MMRSDNIILGLLLILVVIPLVFLTTYLWQDRLDKEEACLKSGGVYVRGFSDYVCVKEVK